jgi:hypothetical protein
VNHISGVMVTVLASSAVDRGFEPRSGQTKDYENGICCFPLRTMYLYSLERGVGIRIMSPSIYPWNVVSVS